MYAGKFSQFVIEYATEWHKVVVARVDKALKEAESLRMEVDHYQSKVESLRQSANEKMAKGKQVDQKTAEKLTRNEEKLVKIKDENYKFIHQACLLVEELVIRSWRDMHPLLIKIFQFDMTISTEEAKAKSDLNGIVNALKQLAVKHGIKAEARLKDIETLNPDTLSTRLDSDTLQIEAGMDGMFFTGQAGVVGASSTGGGDLHFPPGSTALQGMGGCPVTVADSTSSVNSHNHLFPTSQSAASIDSGFHSSSSAAGKAPSTMDMVAISAAAAPPPTMDQLEQTFGDPFQSEGSFDSLDSGRSAPPPAAAPPPPPSSYGVPPTNTLSSYGAPNPFGRPPSQSTPSTNPFGGPPPSKPATNPFGTTSKSPSPFAQSPIGAAPPPPSSNAMNSYSTPTGPPAASPYPVTAQTPLSMYGAAASSGNHPSVYPTQQQAPSSGNYSPYPSQIPVPPAPSSGNYSPYASSSYGQPPPSGSRSNNPFE
jgi:F0F1-type ATP synthase membrane subunit b/b'